MASSAPPVRGRCSPPRHPIRVPNMANGQINAMATPNQKPESRKRREKLSQSFCQVLNGR
jgi:hypothetical protein